MLFQHKQSSAERRYRCIKCLLAEIISPNSLILKHVFILCHKCPLLCKASYLCHYDSVAFINPLMSMQLCATSAILRGFWFPANVGLNLVCTINLFGDLVWKQDVHVVNMVFVAAFLKDHKCNWILTSYVSWLKAKALAWWLFSTPFSCAVSVKFLLNFQRASCCSVSIFPGTLSLVPLESWAVS